MAKAYSGIYGKHLMAIELLSRLSSKGGSTDVINHSINWLFVDAWSRLDKMRRLSEEATKRLEEAKRTAGFLN
jgi:hypothetical protein